MPPLASIAQLRSLVAAWTPPPVSRNGAGTATGVPGIDAALGGGLPAGRVTELVAPGPSCGAELVLASLLATTRTARQRVALVDAANGFVPANYRADHLRHLVWIRAHTLAETLKCADVLVRDGNYAVLVLDLRGVTPRAVRQQPSSVWHRWRLAVEPTPCAVLVLTPASLVPAVPWRLVLRTPATLDDLRRTRSSRIAALTIEVERGQTDQREELAG